MIARRARYEGAVAIAVASFAGGCGASVPLPREADHHGEEPVIVEEPPPPPRAEVLTSPPEGMQRPVWVSGQWLWDGARWEWQPGRWDTQRPGESYAPPKVVYLPERRIGWFPGKWYGRGSR